MAAKKAKKTEPKFDVDEANALLNELGGLLVEDRVYGAKWAALSLVVEFDDESISLTGYVYDAKGKARLAVPENGEVFEVLEALRTTMAVGGLGAWVSALVRITQPGPEIEMDFDYDGGEWDVDADALRPESVAAPKKAKKSAPKKKPAAKKKAARRAK